MASADAIAAVIAAGGAHIPGLMDRVEARLAELAASHGETLAHHAGSTIAAGGKRLRPLLVLVAAGPPRDRHGDGLLRAAVAVELVHSATLVHDDVLDGAALRRGRPTVVAAAGRAIATATGDLLFSRAFAELARNGRADEVRVLSAASSALAEGELLQRGDAWDTGLTRERYLRRCDLKTARLFQAACELGALEADGPVAELGEFGRRIGLAFQLLDDVLDVSGPRLTGLQAAQQLAQRRPATRVLMLSMHDNEEYLFEALRAGAAGYVLKSAVDRDLVEACRATIRGEAFLYPGAVGALIRDHLERAREGGTGAFDPLTSREVEVVKLVAEGMTTRQIAEMLVISPKTVERHRANVLEKLGLRDRVDLTRYAIRRGLIEP